MAACNAEEAVGAEASRAAHSHMAAFEEQNRAFKLHEDNHAQLWHEAKECVLGPVPDVVAGLLKPRATATVSGSVIKANPFQA